MIKDKIYFFGNIKYFIHIMRMLIKNKEKNVMKIM